MTIPSVSAFKCVYCHERWPRTEEYHSCPCCREETVNSYKDPTLDESTAHSQKIHHDFGWWLWDNGRL